MQVLSKDIAKAVDMGATGRLECPHAEYLDWSERRAQRCAETEQQCPCQPSVPHPVTIENIERFVKHL